MKKLATAIAAIALTGTPAFAADLARKMPVKAPPPPPPAPVYSWTGWYVGGNVGYSWGDAKTDLNGAGSVASSNGISGLFPFPIQFTGGSDTVRLKGAIGGPQFGYNYQLNSPWVLGFETDFQISGERGSGTFSDAFLSALCTSGSSPPSACTGFGAAVLGTATTTYTAKIEWFGTLRGRIGFLLGDQFLIYGTGGLAYGRVQTSGITTFSGTVPVFSTSFAFNGSGFSDSKTNVGWTAGAGVEGRFAYWLPANWTWKLEYLYVDLGSLDAVSSFSGVIPPGLLPSPASGTTTTHTHFTDNIVRVGLNYQFH